MITEPGLIAWLFRQMAYAYWQAGSILELQPFGILEAV